MTDLEELDFLLRQEEHERKYNRLAYLYPDAGPVRRELYPKQTELFDATARYRVTTMFGGNGAGKTTTGAYITAIHATGLYPHWWTGHRFPDPTETAPLDMWVAGDTNDTVRDITQLALAGNVAKLGDDALGTGMIPRRCIIDKQYKRGGGYVLDYLVVRHRSGGKSVISFKSYEQKRISFQGTDKHWIWLDEEPPEDIFSECGQRGRGEVDGKMLLTFTPLEGRTPLVDKMMNWDRENRTQGASMFSLMCGMDDVPHLTEAQKSELLSTAPVWQRQARRTGYPVVGTGLIYPVDEAEFVIKPIELPRHWRRVVGFDHGIHNTACVWIAYDKDADVAYVYSDYKRGGPEITKEMHALAIKARGDWIPVVGDCAARDSELGPVIQMYKALGVRMQKANKSNGSVDSGIVDVLSRLSHGKLKVFSTCQKWLDEFRQYAYDDKQRIKKVNDHLMDATRYGIVDGLKVATTEKALAAMPAAEEMTFGIY